MKYTVILLRPEDVCEEIGSTYGTDTYVAYVDEKNIIDAINSAQYEVFAADKKEGIEAASPTDYKVCVALSGHTKVVLYGWQC